MTGIEKVPTHLSVVGKLIDLGKATPFERELLFRDMGMGDPLRTIEDRVDLSDKAKKALKDQEGNPDYDKTGKVYVPR